MINFILKIRNPFSGNNFKTIWEKIGDFTEYKNWEFGIYYHSGTMLGIDIDLSWHGRDHAGPKIELTVLGLNFLLQIYDVRHWDYEKRRWQIYE